MKAFHCHLPDDLRAELDRAAEENLRSTNKEILHRLRESLRAERQRLEEAAA